MKSILIVLALICASSSFADVKNLDTTTSTPTESDLTIVEQNVTIEPQLEKPITELLVSTFQSYLQRTGYLEFKPNISLDIMNHPKVFTNDFGTYVKFQDGKIIGPDEPVGKEPVCMVFQISNPSKILSPNQNKDDHKIITEFDHRPLASQLGDQEPQTRVRYYFPIRTSKNKSDALPVSSFKMDCDSATNKTQLTVSELQKALGNSIEISYVKL